MAKELSEVSLLDIMPGNLLEDEKVRNAAKALDGELKSVTGLIKQVLLISRIDELEEDVIDLLAWQWHVDYYDPAVMTLEKKRQVLKQSLAWHRIKGTPAAVEQVASAILDETEVMEWFEYSGQPYHFRVRTASASTDTETIRRIIEVVTSAKNVRSWLDGIDYLAKFLEEVYKERDIESSLKLGINLPLADDIELGVMRYRRPKEYRNRALWDGSRVFDGSFKYDSNVPHYYADIDYGDADEPELYYQEYDAAQITKLDIGLKPFVEHYSRLKYDGTIKFDGTQKFNGTTNPGITYDTGIALKLIHRDGTEEVIEW